jgi:hypothetical protein
MMTGSRNGPRSLAIRSRMLPGVATKLREDGNRRATHKPPMRHTPPTAAMATRQLQVLASRPPASRPVIPPRPVPLM